MLGIDEAGRGSVLGPLVVGGFLVGEEDLPRLAGLGAKDSKLLRPRVRREVYRRLATVGRRFSTAAAPEEIDRAVRHHELNLLEARLFGRLVRRARPGRVVVDACDPVAARFGRRVADAAGGIAPVVARHHADRDEPVVAAASVVAKVRRDHAVAVLARRLRRDLGSGYPSDPRTVAVVREALAGPDRPAWIRLSWATAERLKPPARVVPLEGYGP